MMRYFLIISSANLLCMMDVLGTTFAPLMSCQNSGCHQELTQVRYLHSPLKTKEKGCIVCHLVVSDEGKHPKFKELNVKANNESCLFCHQELIQKIHKNEFVHKAIEEKSCIACHSPHGSNHPKLLEADPKMDLCLKCHEKIKDPKVNKPHHDIAKMKDGCLTCHETHSSRFGKLLKNAPSQLCFGCHDTGNADIPSVQWAQQPKSNWHTPVRNGECVKCHEQHGSNNTNLLVGKFQKNTYAKDLEQEMELCFKCHKIDKFKSKITKDDTQFRNGTDNLHQLHVFGKKQVKSCSLCHEVHSSLNPSLIKNSFNYSNFNIPIKYNQNSDGGNCTTACHKTFNYRRDKAVVNESDL